MGLYMCVCVACQNRTKDLGRSPCWCINIFVFSAMANTQDISKKWAPRLTEPYHEKQHGERHSEPPQERHHPPSSSSPQKLSIVAPKSMIQSIWEEADEKKHSHTKQSTPTTLGAATSSLAKFKAAQDVRCSRFALLSELLAHHECVCVCVLDGDTAEDPNGEFT